MSINKFEWQIVNVTSRSGTEAGTGWATVTETYTNLLSNGMLVRILTMTSNGAVSEAITFVPKR